MLGNQQRPHNASLSRSNFQSAEWTLMPFLQVVAMACRKDRTQSIQQNCLKRRKDVQGWSYAPQLRSLQQHGTGKKKMFFAQLNRKTAQSAAEALKKRRAAESEVLEGGSTVRHLLVSSSELFSQTSHPR